MSRKKIFSLLILASLFALSKTSVFAATCGLAKIEPGAGGQNWDVTYCVTAATEAEARSITSVTATCREAPANVPVVEQLGRQNCSCYYDSNMNASVRPDLYAVCNLEDGDPFSIPAPPASSSQGVTVTDVVQIPDGSYLTCFTLTSLDRNMGKIDVLFKGSSGSNVCPTQTTDVTPGNYGGWLEYYQNTVATRTGLIPTYNPNPLNPVYCNDVSGKQGINTALGCLSFDAASGGFVSDLLALLIGLGGGIALLLILYGIFIITTSAGIPDKLNTGKEIVTSAVAGLVFIILSIFLMNLVGIRILAIPGLQ